MATIAVFGASGFVGATTVERLLALGSHDVRPLIHSTGNAWRLSRHGLPLRSVDVRDRAAVKDALRGASHVVNCVLGPRDVMLGGLRNLLAESRDARVERFVHLSSVSAWGAREPGAELHESEAPRRPLSGYGRMKRDQDRLVARAARRGLPSLILAPPMISGAYSPFLIRVLDALRRDALALVDGGSLPCSLIDVENLACAIECALFAEHADAKPCFVTDETRITWRDLVESLAPLAENAAPPPSIDLASALRAAAADGGRVSPFATLRALAALLASSDARAVLRRDPLVRGLYGAAGRVLPGAWLGRLRSRPASSGAPARAGARFDPYSLGVQTRALRHAGDGARTRLGYRPELDFAASMRAFTRWYEQTHGFGSEAWPLVRQL